MIFILILSTIVLIATALPLIHSGEWWIRMLDFPRIQIAVLTLLAIILATVFLNFKWEYKLPLLLILAVALVYQVEFVVVYTPLCKTQAKDSNQQTEESSLFLLVSNVLMESEDKARFHALVNKYNPDILLINEPDTDNTEGLEKTDLHRWPGGI